LSETSKLKIIPLGGLEAIGMNITAFEYEDSIVVVDCGLAFPEDDMYGIDLVIPDITYLLENAEKYTPEGGNIRMVVNRDRKMHLRIVISNNGDPIPPEALQKIFERFYRVDPARSRDTGGYGLGLCVAKSIAELHGGTITATSENGINVFTVLLGELQTEDVKS
jgi:signal transduction histidine kinase